jgi:hypothetical protein
MDDRPQRHRRERLPLSPGIQNSLEGDEMMTVGPLLVTLGIGAIILVILVVALL